MGGTSKVLRLLGGVLVIATVIPSSVGAIAQSSTTGSIAGTVRDTTGAVLPGVTVEASSPALIEKTRSALTDAQGNFKILDLRPGTYAVTFALEGFSTVKREGLELATGFTANVSVELKVGSVEETVTVSGASPIVDVQNVRYQQVLSREAWDALPTGKTLNDYVQITLGATMAASGQDVGGTKGDKSGGGGSFSFHGAGINDQAIVVDGMAVNAQTTGGGPWTRTTVNNDRAFEETTIGSGVSAENENAGIVINLVPRDGGNRFGGTFALNGSSGSLESSNLTADLIARGVPVQGKITKLYDAGSGFGGPLKQDRLWFYVSDRWWNAASIVPGSFYNATPQPAYGSLPVYSPDISRPAIGAAPNHDDDGRVTWQVNDVQKISGFIEFESQCNCYFGASNTRMPEATENLNAPYWSKNLVQGTWSYARGTHWLFSVGDSMFFSLGKNGTDRSAAMSRTAIPIKDLTTGVLYNGFGDDPYPYGVCCSPFYDGNLIGKTWAYDQRYTVTYSTGSQTLKFGARTYEHGNRPGTSSYNNTPLGNVEIMVRGGVCLTPGCTPPAPVPAAVLPLISPQGPASATTNTGAYHALDTAAFVQEQLTLKRATLNLGLRYDAMHGTYDTYTTVASNLLPSQTLPGADNSPNWKDIDPRVGVAFDVFGNGKTAVKGSWGRFVVHQSDFGLSPASRLGYGAGTRTWNDTNHNFVPDCDLTNPLANGECGAEPNVNRGVAAKPTTFYDPALLSGWWARPYLWNSTLSLTQELRPGLAVTAGYFRTTNGNITVTQNQATAPSDYTSYCVTAPTNSRLASQSGSQICGLYDVNPNKFGQVNNLVTFGSNFGTLVNSFDGFDFSVNARFGKGGLLQGGVSTARTVVDNCALNARPDLNDGQTAGSPRNDAYCRVVTPWGQTAQVKFLGNYPLPWWGLQVSATYQYLPGPVLAANLTYTSAQIAPTLGRNLSSGAAGTVSVALLPPAAEFDSRFSETDLRIAKVLKLGRLRAQGQVDIYNIFNSSAVLAENGTYGPAWLSPSSILGARLLKVGMQLDLR